jgi:hypothetical protein
MLERPLIHESEIRIATFVAPSLIENAGQGLFSVDDIPKGKIIAAPLHVKKTYSYEDVFGGEASHLVDKAVRWFENRYFTTEDDDSPDWFFNHSFEPNCLAHLGFIFAIKDIQKNEELTLDYSFILAPEAELDYRDSKTGKKISGKNWERVLKESSQILSQLF